MQTMLLVSSVLLVAIAKVPDKMTGQECPDNLQAVYQDMHDGDEKEVIVSGTSMTIKPFGNNETWKVTTTLDVASCSANVDFRVPGKPGPPPVSLKATLWHALSSQGKKSEFEFTDPSGTLAAKNFPLNRWVELHKDTKQQTVPCQRRLEAVYQDMHDGDKKLIILEDNGTSMLITPYGNNQTWKVKATVNLKTCSAIINFNVPGKPSPPPVNLTATFLYNERNLGDDRKTEYEFTDPSGKLAAADFPLNHWVEISRDPLAGMMV